MENQTSEYTICLDPITGAEIGRSPLDRPEDVPGLVHSARTAQVAWAAQPVRLRARHMRRVRDLLVDRADDIAAVIAADCGKSRIDAMGTELLPSSMAADYYSRRAARFLRERRPRPSSILLANKRTRILRRPHGVVGIISPWNYPFAIPFSEVVMALLAGNAVVLKVASETQATGRELERCFTEAGLPHGIFRHINLPGRVAGSALLDAGIDKLFFTGSIPVGRILMRKAAETLTPLVLELGGNDAMLVCPDADLERAASGAVWAGMQNCGQSCGGVERIYVHEAVSERFLALLKEKVETLRIGSDENFGSDIGALTTERQADAVREQVEDALSRGATVFARAEAPVAGGSFLPALVLTGVDHTMAVMREETFGPVLGVMTVRNMDEAVALANDTNYGLSASVWSRDRWYARGLAHRIEAGAVLVNDHLMNHGMPEAPWGGCKQSGFGRTHGREGFDEMTWPQVLVDDLLPQIRRDLWWFPYGKDLYHGLAGALRLLFSRSPTARLSGLRRLLRIVSRCFTRG